MAKYPLKPLLEHRENKALQATEELGRAVHGRQAAEAERERAEERRKAAAAQIDEVRREESDRLVRGELRAVDLSRADAWAMEATSRLDDLSRAEAVATERASAAQATESFARTVLAKKSAERDVVAKDEERFVLREQARALAAEEEAAADVVAARRRRT
jgi:hypothetical protein